MCIYIYLYDDVEIKQRLKLPGIGGDLKKAIMSLHEKCKYCINHAY